MKIIIPSIKHLQNWFYILFLHYVSCLQIIGIILVKNNTSIYYNNI